MLCPHRVFLPRTYPASAYTQGEWVPFVMSTWCLSLLSRSHTLILKASTMSSTITYNKGHNMSMATTLIILLPSGADKSRIRCQPTELFGIIPTYLYESAKPLDWEADNAALCIIFQVWVCYLWLLSGRNHVHSRPLVLVALIIKHNSEALLDAISHTYMPWISYLGGHSVCSPTPSIVG